MANFATYRHKSYDGGLKQTASRRELERDQASHLENWDITYKGRLVSRKGLTQVGNTVSGVIHSAGVYENQNGTRHLLINEGTTVRVLDGSSFATVGTTSTLSAGERLSWANVIVEDKIYLSSTNNGLKHWDGGAGGLTAVADSPAGNIIFWYKNHLFHINQVKVSSTTYPNRVYWSDFGDPEAYTPESSFVELPGEGRAITMNGLGDVLVLFKENSYMFLTGYGSESWTITAGTSSIDNIDSSVGCVAPRGTVRVGNNELWFIDNYGDIRRIKQTDFGFESEVMSNNLDTSKINVSRLPFAVASYDDDKVYFAVSSSGSNVNDLVYVFDRKASKRAKSEAWTTITGWQVQDFVIFGSTPTLHVIPSNIKEVFSHSGGSDDGAAINCRWDGKNDDYDQPERYKKYAYGYLYSQAQGSQKVSIHAGIDGKTFAQLAEMNLDSTGTLLGPTGPATMGPTGAFILGGSDDLEKKYYFADGGGNITGKTMIMSIRASVTARTYVDTFTNHFVIRSLK